MFAPGAGSLGHDAGLAAPTPHSTRRWPRLGRNPPPDGERVDLGLVRGQACSTSSSVYSVASRTGSQRRRRVHSGLPWYCAAQIQQRLSQAFLDTESTAADGDGGGTGATAPRPERAAANGECHSPGVLSEDRPRPKDRSVGGGHSAPSSAAPTSFRPGQVGDELEHSSALLWSATATRCRLLLPLVLVTAALLARLRYGVGPCGALPRA